jgi:NADH dehydrogenase [ubiquinone] 1 alpha subcomplex assembly factor 5
MAYSSIQRPRGQSLAGSTRILGRGRVRGPCASTRAIASSNRDEESATHAFDRSVKLLQRNNAGRRHARRHGDKFDPQAAPDYDYIRDEVALRLVDRLEDIRRDEGFPLALDYGSGAGHVYRAICSQPSLQSLQYPATEESSHPVGGIGGVRKLVQLDSADAMIFRDKNRPFDGAEYCDTYRLCHDEEAVPLPFPDGTFDLVISSASLHWVNKLPSVMSEIKRVLRDDGCFMLAMVGGTTLPELRASMVLAELERDGGVSPHVGPFVELSDVGALLQRAGFALPTIDTDSFKVSFPNAFVLMEHLQRMGESNASVKRRDRISQDTFLAAACVYDQMFPLFDDGSSSSHPPEIEASVQIIYAIGWKPHESQQRPKQRGSATHKVGAIVEQTKAG